MSKIGNKAFTLVEAMVTTVILSLGTVFIFGSFFVTLDTYQYCTHYFNVMPWADNKIWEIQDSLSSLGPAAHFKTSGGFTQENMNYTWGVSYGPAESIDKLYKIDLMLAWQEGKRQVRVKRSAYARYKE
jgi:Prokaryotic N-terminal methylation motif